VGIVRRVFARSFAQVDAYAAQWSAANEAALAAGGPLWVVLGSSAAQAPEPPATTRGTSGSPGSDWSPRSAGRGGCSTCRAAARARDAVNEQWPAASALVPDLLRALVGGSFALRTKEKVWRRDVEDLCAALPPGVVVATVARGVFERKAAWVNALIRQRAAERGLRVAGLWRHTGPPYCGLYIDGFHPNDKGYLQWADALEEALTSRAP
jgi:hypothetical protein